MLGVHAITGLFSLSPQHTELSPTAFQDSRGNIAKKSIILRKFYNFSTANKTRAAYQFVLEWYKFVFYDFARRDVRFWQEIKWVRWSEGVGAAENEALLRFLTFYLPWIFRFMQCYFCSSAVMSFVAHEGFKFYRAKPYSCIKCLRY